jgi:hypothetical protein
MKDSVPASLDLRLRLGQAALLTIDEAAMLLPVPPAQGRAWIEGNVRRTTIAGVASVRWSDVLLALEKADPHDRRVAPAEPEADSGASRWLSTEDAAGLLGVSRATIDRAISGLPANRRPAQLPSRGKGARVRFGWVGEEALRAWWEGVTADPTPRKKVAPKRKAAQSQEVVDWSAAARDARRKGRP